MIFLNFKEVILSSLFSNDPLFKIQEKLEYENNEIPNSLHGSLSCVEFPGSTKMQQNMICNDDLMHNIPN